ncbi:Eco47II family restriction endonuclease [Vreelandella venusta]|uniref:Eco47II family restriction endonuclease n=1 Tax=Vreelandella venusta TaxID=44935 RepID=A0ABX2BG17_9GAMM|nr:Eco47II family restriction endonuclease [Halomonas venusta]AZM97801.1 Eco47II family restriction endonuclease [Halomonas venusta]NPT32338.1 Eco47II family restriction endonuclease [Halomonas venusta]
MNSFNRNKLKEAISGSICRVYKAQINAPDIYRNTLDCFSAAIDSVSQGISLDEWVHQEKERQVQKTKQNAIGSLHEEVMGSIEGVDNLAVGNLIDIVCHNKKILAEVKNKYNTTKGNHKVSIYRDLAKAIEKNPGYIGYYVEVLPKNCSIYNEPFTPSDNQTGTRLPLREDIRKIDGRSFYEILTGQPYAIDELYKELPSLVAEIINENFETSLDSRKVSSSDSFTINFIKAYGKNSADYFIKK